MSRVIKFRGKSKDDDEWGYGYYWESSVSGKSYIHIYPHEELSKNPCVEVIPETVGQFTGLKDKEGVDIYEGDIVSGERLVDRSDIKCAMVVYRENHGIYSTVLLDGLMATLIWNKSKVIGNIHDNPELLER